MPHVVRAQVAAHRAHAPAGVRLVGVHRADQRVLHALQVVRVAQERLSQLAGRTGELGEHQRATQVDAGRDVFLGHQVHAVP